MKKSYLKEIIKNREKFISEQSVALAKQNDIIQRYKFFIKHLEHQLSLAAELNDQKDLDIEKLHSVIVSQKVSIPLIKETEYELFEAEKDVFENFAELFNSSEQLHKVTSSSVKDVVDSPTTFSSRFMPESKCTLTLEDVVIIFPSDTVLHHKLVNLDAIYCVSTNSGRNISLFSNDPHSVRLSMSKYEVIPELVPKGMVYDKESDSLVQKVCINYMCQG